MVFRECLNSGLTSGWIQIIGEDSLRDMIFELIGVAEMEGWTANLISAARESSPRNASLMAFSQQFGLTPAGLPTFSAAAPVPPGCHPTPSLRP